MSVTVVRGAGNANGDVPGAQTLRVDRVAASALVSNGPEGMEQEAITVALTPKLEVAVAASVGASLTHVMTTAMVTMRIALDSRLKSASPSYGCFEC